MQTGTLVSELIQHINDNTVSHSGSDVWDRPLAVNANDRSREQAVRIGSHPCDVEVVYDGGCLSEHAKA